MCLYEHLASKRMLHFAMKQEIEGVEEDFAVQKICITIAHLLNFIPRLQPTILRDLITFLFDLAVTAEADLLSSDAVEISIFCEASGQDHSIKILNEGRLVLLQLSTLNILHTLLTLQQAKQTESQTIDKPTEVPLEGPFDHVNCFWGHVLGDGALLADLLACFRQILLSDPPQNPKFWSLFLDAKISAAQLLNFLLADQDRLVASSSGLPSCLALLVAQSAAAFFDSLGQCPPELKSKSEVLGSYINEAIRNNIISSPHDDAMIHDIRLQSIGPLIDSLQPLARLLPQGGLLALGKGTLLAIHVCMSTASPLTNKFVIAKTVTSQFTMNGAMSALLELLKDWSLAKEAVIVLDRLFSLTRRDLSFDQSELGSSCLAAWAELSTDHEAYDVPTEVQESPVSGEASPKGGKRKRPVKKSPKRPAAKVNLVQALVLQRSPKRQRSDGNVATPSPAGCGFTVPDLHSNTTSQTIPTPDSLTALLYHALKCAQRILSVDSPLPTTDTRSSDIGVASTSGICLVINFFTMLSHQIATNVKSKGQEQNFDHYRATFPEAGFVFDLLAMATQRVAQSLSSHLQTLDPDRMQLCSEVLIVADALFCGALSVHINTADSTGKSCTDTCLHHISQTAWQMWQRFRGRNLSVAGDVYPRVPSSSKGNDAPSNRVRQPQPPIFDLELIYQTTLVERYVKQFMPTTSAPTISNLCVTLRPQNRNSRLLKADWYPRGFERRNLQQESGLLRRVILQFLRAS
jgi:hypothetical protein